MICDNRSECLAEVFDEECDLRRHFADLRRHFETQLQGFGVLNLTLTELCELEACCLEYGLSADLFAALDQAIVSGGSASLTINVQSDAQAIDDEKARKGHAEVLTCLGAYFSLFNRRDLADAQYMAALEADSLCIAAQLGHTKALVEELAMNRKTTPSVESCNAQAACNSEDHADHAEQHPPKALSAALHCVGLVVQAACMREHDINATSTILWERCVCQCFHILDDVVALCGTCHSAFCGDAMMQLLETWVQFLTTPAAFVIQSLARRLLAPKGKICQPLLEVGVATIQFPNCVKALLMESETFCHIDLEGLIIRWRAGLCGELHTIIVNSMRVCAGTKGDPSDEQLHGLQLAPLIENTSAIACHLHYVSYCVPWMEGDADEGGGQQSIALELAKQVLVTYSNEVACASAWLLVALYQNPGRLEPNSVFDSSTPASPEIAPRLLVGHAAGCPALAMLLDHCLNFPKEEASLAAALETQAALPGLTSVDTRDLGLKAQETPCRDFYDHIAYPPWHYAVEAAGMLPLTIQERWRRYFPWWGSSRAKNGSASPRILIAGCGTGHQVAVELRTYAGCEVVALELSPHSLARAVRKLRLVLTANEFARVEFVCGDIMALDAESALVGNGFDLVICCGVLMCLNDPGKGLAKLAACMVPDGALHLATYSRCSVESWRPPIIAYLQTSATARHLYDTNATGEGLRRAPSQTEARAIRAEVLALPRDHEVRDWLIQFREFFTYAGLLDLLFHPQEEWYTLPELESGPFRIASLRPVGLVFGDVNADLRARSIYRDAYGTRDTEGSEIEDHMIDMSRWHELEKSDPNLCGRMHQVLLELVDKNVNVQNSASTSEHGGKRQRIHD